MKKTSGDLNEINDGIGAELKAMLVEMEEEYSLQYSNLLYSIYSEHYIYNSKQQFYFILKETQKSLSNFNFSKWRMQFNYYFLFQFVPEFR